MHYPTQYSLQYNISVKPIIYVAGLPETQFKEKCTDINNSLQCIYNL